MFVIRSYSQWYCFSSGNCLSWCEDKWWRRSCCDQRRPVWCKRTCRKEWGMLKNTTCNMWDWHVTRDHCMLKVLVGKNSARTLWNLETGQRFTHFKQTHILHFSITLLNALAVLSVYLSWTCFWSSFLKVGILYLWWIIVFNWQWMPELWNWITHCDSSYILRWMFLCCADGLMPSPEKRSFWFYLVKKKRKRSSWF